MRGNENVKPTPVGRTILIGFFVLAAAVVALVVFDRWPAVWPLTAAKFLEGFWPNLLATLMGVVAGVPAGLWLSRAGLRHAAREQERANDARLILGLDELLHALVTNQAFLGRLSDELAGNRILPFILLDTSAWEACRHEIVPFLRNPSLQHRLALHFVNLQRVEAMVGLWSQPTSPVESTYSKGFLGQLQSVISVLLSETGGLITEVDGHARRLRNEPPASSPQQIKLDLWRRKPVPPAP